jgi:hypothetical protein
MDDLERAVDRVAAETGFSVARLLDELHSA